MGFGESMTWVVRALVEGVLRIVFSVLGDMLTDWGPEHRG